MLPESEYLTRKKRIDTRLTRLGWTIVPWNSGLSLASLDAHAVEEFPTESGPADYALFVNGILLGFIEAKKVSVASLNVLEQAKRYARTTTHGPGDWNGYQVPFLFASNGTDVHFLDVRSGQDISRKVADFYPPYGLHELAERTPGLAADWFASHPIDNPRLRPYQVKAIAATEKALGEGRRRFMLEMATGTGKTFTMVSSVYRLLESKQYRRILFLVDRRALAAQAAVTFAAFVTPQGNKFIQEYEVYSQRFRREDLDENEPFDPQTLDDGYLTHPDSSKTFVYICTIQRMAIALYGPGVAEDELDDTETEEADLIDIPVHAFDLIIADECHRGYTSHVSSVWRDVLEHFDAVKIGLTATPAAHTTAYFGPALFHYRFDDAVLDGFLVGYNAVRVYSNIRMHGVFLREGDQVQHIDTESGQLRLEMLEDQRDFDASDVERRITAPDSNRRILEEIKKYTDDFELERGHFPKTLIFAVNDQGHASHADQLVQLAKQLYNRGDDFVLKITGNPNVDRPLEKIRRFRNQQEPGIVVSVDMLTTGVDIPKLEYIVFLRPVKSRILWEQMLGRGTRRCDEIGKDSFTVFDCFDGTLLNYFNDASNMKLEEVKSNTLSISEVIQRVADNIDRDYYERILVKRLHRAAQATGLNGRQAFAPFIPGGDLEAFANGLRDQLRRDFAGTIGLLRLPGFLQLLTNPPRPKPTFLIAEEALDTVDSAVVFTVGKQVLQAAEYLREFDKFVQSKKTEIEAMRMLFDAPESWNPATLRELRWALLINQFPEISLQRATRIARHKELADIISIIRHAATGDKLLSAAERVQQAIQRVFAGITLAEEQQAWLSMISKYLEQNLTLEEEDFNIEPLFVNRGGLARFRKLFPEHLDVIRRINAAIAA